MLTKLREKSSEPARRLAELACLVGERPVGRRFLERVDEDTQIHLAEADKEVAAAFAAQQQEFGCRALRYEAADPTLAESPALILGII